MAQQDFIQQLAALGYLPEDRGGGRVVIDYTIESGVRFLGQAIKLGFEIPGDYPLQAPSGPHVSPQLLPINPGGAHPDGAIHASPIFDRDGEYWSRPYREWQTLPEKTVEAYMKYIRHLFRQ